MFFLLLLPQGIALAQTQPPTIESAQVIQPTNKEFLRFESEGAVRIVERLSYPDGKQYDVLRKIELSATGTSKEELALSVDVAPSASTWSEGSLPQSFTASDKIMLRSLDLFPKDFSEFTCTTNELKGLAKFVFKSEILKATDIRQAVCIKIN